MSLAIGLPFFGGLAVDLRVFRAGTPVSRQMRDIRDVLVAYLQAFYGFLKFLYGSPNWRICLAVYLICVFITKCGITLAFIAFFKLAHDFMEYIYWHFCN